MKDSPPHHHPFFFFPLGCSELSEWHDQNSLMQMFLLPSQAVVIYKVQHAVSARGCPMLLDGILMFTCVYFLLYRYSYTTLVQLSAFKMDSEW